MLAKPASEMYAKFLTVPVRKNAFELLICHTESCKKCICLEKGLDSVAKISVKTSDEKATKKDNRILNA